MALFERAQAAATAVREAAGEMGIPVTVCVVDANGMLVLKERMDGAMAVSLEMAELKAQTSAFLGMPTMELAELVQPGAPLFGITSVGGGRFVAIGGGVPLHENGVLVAGLGVSGGMIEDDVQLANAGLTRFTELTESMSPGRQARPRGSKAVQQN